MSLDEQIQKIAAGDMTAFDPLYEETKGTVFYIALSILRERSLAEDVMQTCYLKVIRYAGKYRQGTNAAAWIARIAKNEALDLKRKRAREHLVDTGESEYLFPTYTVDESSHLIDIARKVLKDGEFSVVMLVAEGYKRREIAEMLKVPLPTVTWRYNHAIKKLRHAIQN